MHLLQQLIHGQELLAQTFVLLHQQGHINGPRGAFEAHASFDELRGVQVAVAAGVHQLEEGPSIARLCGSLKRASNSM